MTDIENNWTTDELSEVLSEVLHRTSVDPQFRALAVKDSVAAISKVNPKPLPTDVTFKFIENTGSVKYIPLPEPVPGVEELSAEELEAVAGGGAAPVSNPVLHLDAGTGQAAGGISIPLT